MERKVVYSGKIQPGISKSSHCLEIINTINEFKIKKEMKQILFLAVMKILPAYKRNKDILFHLESFKRNGRVFPEFSTSKYVQKVIDEVDPYYNPNLSLKGQSFTFSKDEYERRKKAKIKAETDKSWYQID